MMVCLILHVCPASFQFTCVYDEETWDKLPDGDVFNLGVLVLYKDLVMLP